MFLSKQLYGIPGKTCRQLFSAHTSTFYIPGIYLHLKALSMHEVSFFSPELIYHITEGSCVCEREHTTFM